MRKSSPSIRCELLRAFWQYRAIKRPIAPIGTGTYTRPVISDPVTRADLLAIRSELRAYVDFRTAAVKSDIEFSLMFERHQKRMVRLMIIYVVGLNLIAVGTVLLARRLGWF